MYFCCVLQDLVKQFEIRLDEQACLSPRKGAVPKSAKRKVCVSHESSWILPFSVRSLLLTLPIAERILRSIGGQGCDGRALLLAHQGGNPCRLLLCYFWSTGSSVSLLLGSFLSHFGICRPGQSLMLPPY
jgi:hypothetical protein